MKKYWMFGSLSACVVTATVACYVLPIPFKSTALLLCGIASGRLLARWV